MQLTDDRPWTTTAPRGSSRGTHRQPPSVGFLVDAARSGSVLAFEHLYRSMAGHVSAYLRWHRVSDPDGLTNDVFLQVYRNLGGFEGDERSFRSWVFTIAHHRMIDDRRRASRQPRIEGDLGTEDLLGTGDVEDDAFALLAHDRVRDLLALLSPEQRDVVLLRIVADLSVHDVAAILGKGEGAVKALQHRALASLRRHLGFSASRRSAPPRRLNGQARNVTAPSDVELNR